MTLSDAKGTAKHKRFEAVAVSCCIDRLNIEHGVEHHKFGVKVDLNITIDLVLADYRYDVQMRRKVDHEEYYVFHLNDMRDLPWSEVPSCSRGQIGT